MRVVHMHQIQKWLIELDISYYDSLPYQLVSFRRSNIFFLLRIMNVLGLGIERDLFIGSRLLMVMPFITAISFDFFAFRFPLS